MVQRLKQHVEDTETDDRPFKVQAMYEQMREEESQREATSQASEITASVSESVDDSIIDLADRIRRSRRDTLVNHIEEQEYVF